MLSLLGEVRLIACARIDTLLRMVYVAEEGESYSRRGTWTERCPFHRLRVFPFMLGM